jgi:hypothetical protein
MPGSIEKRLPTIWKMGNEGSGVFSIGLKWVDGEVAGVG